MFWFVPFVICLILAISFFFASIHYGHQDDKLRELRHKANEEGDRIEYDKLTDKISSARDKEETSEGVCVFFVCLMLLFGLIVGIGAALFYSSQFDLRSKETLLPIKVEQKTELISLVEDQLSPEQLADLTAATAIDSITYIFGANAASSVLIERANQIVLLNAEINGLKNDITNIQLDICNNIDNIFYPRVPGFGPDCQVDFSPQTTDN